MAEMEKQHQEGLLVLLNVRGWRRPVEERDIWR